MPQTQGYLIIEKKNGTDGKPHPVDRTLKLGRGQSCDVRVHVQSVSDEHCIIIVKPGRPVCIQNLSGTTPTLLNGVSIGAKKCELQHGDYVSLGERRFRWEYLDTSPFYRLELGSMRRKSDADAIVRRSSQPVAVVFPMVHPRRTMEPSIVSQVKRNFARVSAASRLSVPAGAEKASSSSPPPEKVQYRLREVEGRSSPKQVGQQSEPAVFKTPRKVLEGKPESRKSLRTSVTPQTKQPASASKQTPKSTSAQKVKGATAQKRKLSITPIPAKRLKIESPKSLDKRKVAALLGIHGKSPAAIRTFSPTKSASSVKKSAQSAAKKSAKSASRSTQKSRRPLFSEILKKAVARANAPPKTPGKSKLGVATKKTLFSGVAKKKAIEKQQSLSALTKVLPKLHVQSTGHANSPETFFVGRKLTASRDSQGVLKSPAEWVKSARKSAAVGDLPKQATPKRKGPLRLVQELPSTGSPVAKLPVKSPNFASPKKSPVVFTARRSVARTATPKSPKRTSVANPLWTKTPVRASLSARGSPATKKSTTPKATTPKAVTPKPATPKAATPKPATPKAATPKPATPKSATPKAATPKPATPKAATPKPATPKSATPKAATPKAATPKAATPKAATPKPATPKPATPKPATPKAATPKPATPKAATPKPLTPKAATPKAATPKAATPKPATPKPATPKAATPKPATPKAATPKPATPKSATPKAATPKPATPKAATPKPLTPKPATPKAATPKPATPKAATPKPATPKPVTPKVATSESASPKTASKPSPRVLRKIAKELVKRASLPIPLRVKTPRLANRASLPKGSKLVSPKVLKLASPIKSPKPATPTFLIRLSPVKSPKSSTPRPSVRVSLAKSSKPISPKSAKRESLVKSPKQVSASSTRLVSVAKSPKPTTPKSPKHTAPTPQSNTSVSPHRKASPNPVVSEEATLTTSPEVSPQKPAVTPKKDTPKIATPQAATVKPSTSRSPQRLSIFATPNPILEAMKKASTSSPLKRLSFPSTSDFSDVDVRKTPTDTSSAKRARESSPSALSPEKSKRSAFGDSLVQSLRDRMAKFSPDRSKRFSTASTVVIKSPTKSTASASQPVTSTPAPGHRSSILIRGGSGLTSSPPKSAQSHDSSGRSKNLSVTFSEILVSPSCTPSSSKLASQSATPENEKTSFDFSAVKTPNVPRELYVSSILSSSSKSHNSSAKTSGSAKRKVRVTGSRESVTAALCSDRRSSRSPLTPGGYVDVKGIKRLTTAPIKSPTYLAVEGVKRLFGEAKALASDSYTSISGVRELFASPSPSRNRSPEKTVARDSVASSPVAKIQAQVEERNWNAPRVESPKPAPTLRKKRTKASESSDSPVQGGPTTRSAVNPRVRIASPKSPSRVTPESPPKATKSEAEAPIETSPEKNKPAPGKHRRVVSFDLPEAFSPSTTLNQETKDTITSPVKKPEEKVSVTKRGRPKRAAVEQRTSPLKETASPVTKRGRTTRAAVEDKASPVKGTASPVTKRGRTTRVAVEDKASPVKETASPVTKRSRGTRVATEVAASPVAKRGRPTRTAAEDKATLVKASPVAKRGRATRAAVEDKASPVAKRGRATRAAAEEAASPAGKRSRQTRVVAEERTSPVAKRGRATRAAAEEGVSPARESASPVAKRGRQTRTKAVEKTSPEQTSPVPKRGRVTRAKDTSPVTKRATSKIVIDEKPGSPSKKDGTVSPVSKRPTRKVEVEPKTSPAAKRTKRAKKATSPVKTTKAKKTSKAKSPKPSPKPSPRKTRQRK